MIDPEILTDEQLYVEIHTWEHQRAADPLTSTIALTPLLGEAAQRWMADHTPPATVNPPVVRGPVVRAQR